VTVLLQGDWTRWEAFFFPLLTFRQRFSKLFFLAEVASDERNTVEDWAGGSAWCMCDGLRSWEDAVL